MADEELFASYKTFSKEYFQVSNNFMCHNISVEAPFSPISGVRGNRSAGQPVQKVYIDGSSGNAKIDSTLGQLIISPSGQNCLVLNWLNNHIRIGGRLQNHQVSNFWENHASLTAANDKIMNIENAWTWVSTVSNLKN